MPRRKDDLDTDPLLHTAPMVGGFKVLDPAVLYAKVGQGGMGAVYRGRHVSLDCDVAVKVLKPDLAHDEQFVARFEREARLAARITSDNVVRVLDVRERDGIHYLVMEFVKGETARERVQRKGPLSESAALAILTGAVRGLTFAHKAGIVHRDIKPENVLIAVDGAVKLADLGLAKAKSGGGQSMTALTTGVMGTPQYMPPEQWQSSDVTPAADIWSLGATLYYLLVGKSGIEADELFNMGMRIRDRDFPKLEEARADVRPEVAALLAKCTARQPGDRYRDAMELLKALHALGAVDSDVLVDAQSGLGSIRMTTVTPPPKATLARIKLRLRETDGAGDSREARTTVTKRRSAAMWGWLLGVVLVGLALVGVGYAQGWFASSAIPVTEGEPADAEDNPKDSQSPIDNATAARRAYARGMAELPRVDRLDAAIDAFELALQLDPELPDGPQNLVLALASRAKELQDKDLDEAYRQVVRARELLPEATTWRPVCVRIEKALRQRLLSGLSVEQPTTGQWLAQRLIAVRGRMVTDAFRAVRVAVDARSDASKQPFPRDTAQAVQVIAGGFSATSEVDRDGEFVLRIEAEDQNGVFAELPAVAVRVDTAKPELQVTEPVADALVAAKVRLAGRVRDANATTVTVAGKAASVSGDGWVIDLVLEDGLQELLVVARDAAGLEAKLVHTVRVDADAPSLQVDALPKVTREDSITVRGTVRDVSSVVVTLGDEQVQVAADGQFELKVPLPAEQAYLLQLVAADQVGNRTSQRLSTLVDRTAPVLAWVSPKEVIAQPGKVLITGTVRDAGATTIKVNQQVVVVDGGRWQCSVDLADGQSLVCTVTAEDEAGNRAKSLVRTLVGKDAVVALAWADAVAGAGTVEVDGKTYPRVVVEKQAGMRMVLIEPGTFQMGSPANEADRSSDEKQHRRVIGKAFWLGQTEVSQAQWQKIMGNNPSYFTGDVSCPVENVSWEDCQTFVAKLNGQNGKGSFRLPSEAEWEYACRAGTATPFSFGRTITPAQVNYDGNYPYAGAAKGEFRQRTVPVGSLPANPWGLHEMHGNVYEWCQDGYGSYPDSGTEEAARAGGSRVLRGGSWYYGAKGCRSSYRNLLVPGYRDFVVGFRFSRTL